MNDFGRASWDHEVLAYHESNRNFKGGETVRIADAVRWTVQRHGRAE